MCVCVGRWGEFGGSGVGMLGRGWAEKGAECSKAPQFLLWAPSQGSHTGMGSPRVVSLCHMWQ